MKRWGWPVIASLLVIVGGFLGTTCRAAYQVEAICLPNLRLVDVHSHFSRGREDFPELAAFMKRNAIDLMGLSGLVWKDGDRLVAQTRYVNDGFLPFLRDFDPERSYSIDYVRNRLETGIFKGVGELFINGHGRRLVGDQRGLMEIYQLAGEYEVPILVHWTLGSLSEYEPGTRAGFRQFKNALVQAASTTFILAHCGKGPPPCRPEFPAILDHLLKRYPNLMLDLSGLHGELFADDGTHTPWGRDLLNLIRRHPDRFLLGFDLSQPRDIGPKGDAVVRLFRCFLSSLSATVAEKVGRRNAMLLFGRCPDPRLDKKRRPLLIRGDKGFLPLEYPIPD